MRQAGKGVADRDWPGAICIANASTWSVWGSRPLLRTNCFPRLSSFISSILSFVCFGGFPLTRLTTGDVFRLIRGLVHRRHSLRYVTCCIYTKVPRAIVMLSIIQSSFVAGPIIPPKEKTKNENDKNKTKESSVNAPRKCAWFTSERICPQKKKPDFWQL